MSSLEQSKPWLPLGISRATWFRRQKETGATKPNKVRPRPAQPLGRPLHAHERTLDAQLEAIEARDRVAEWSGAGYREADPQRSALAPRRADEPRGRDLALYNPPTRPSMTAGRTVKPASKRAEGMVASGGEPPGPPLNIEITQWQLGQLLQTRRADQAEIAAWKDRADRAERRSKELEREKSAKAASQAKWWAEAQRLFFNMIRP
jgi:hypothetical protein